MTLKEQKKLAIELSSVSVFRNVSTSRALSLFSDFLKSEDEEERAKLYGEFVYELKETGNSLSKYLTKEINQDENFYVISVAKKEKVSAVVKSNVRAELQLFTRLTELKKSDVFGEDYPYYAPEFDNSRVDFVKEYAKRLKNISKFGYGIFADSEMFKVLDGDIIPVESADDIKLESFVGYEDERAKVFENTRALLAGKHAANVLLFGDAGTGKSSTVKACVNHFFKDGLRLIEIRKDQLLSLASVMGKIRNNPLKFIIFIDDLSFNKNDDSFSMLKAALEGSASAKADNAVIYATSNRRHIIKESFADRNSTDDVHRNDTMQELLSLSDRFGLSVYFPKPNKELYLKIVRDLAARKNINVDSDLEIKAEAFALNKGSRSPRTAEQFVNGLE